VRDVVDDNQKRFTHEPDWTFMLRDITQRASAALAPHAVTRCKPHPAQQLSRAPHARCAWTDGDGGSPLPCRRQRPNHERLQHSLCQGIHCMLHAVLQPVA